MKRIKNKGSIIMITMLIMSSLMVVTLGVSSVLLVGIRMGGAQARSTKAFFAAEAGAERIMWNIRKNGTLTTACNVGDYMEFFDTTPAVCNAAVQEYILPNDAKYYVIFEQSAPEIKIKCYGEYLGTKRAIEVSY